MAKALSRKRVASEEYESDDGFVEDAPKSKKSKIITGAATGAFNEQTEKDGSKFWEITRTRRVQVSDFKGMTMIAIREFYEKDGKMLPGKKGITLTVEQFNAVVDLLPNIEGLLTSKGLIVSRPEYSEEKAAVGKAVDESSADADTIDNAKSRHRANHEATSDEEGA